MRFNQIIRAVPAIALMAAAGFTHAAPARGDAGSTYQEDRAACAQLSASDSRSACLQEAAAARQAMRSGQLAPSADMDYQRNAEQRCTVFREPMDRDACIARVKNGPVSGSVGGGGVLLEAQTQVPAGTPGAVPMPMRDGMDKPMPPHPDHKDKKKKDKKKDKKKKDKDGGKGPHKHGPKHGPDGKPEPRPMPEGGAQPMPPQPRPAS